ncbi:thiamine phosphate synthase [Pedobacter sp. P351]|uniref:thiamine phosphate synthase n=1 Tax=Pedobacter superstes TaxID=3133441 RepID=UPI0030A7B872
MIVITAPEFFEGEAEILNQLFESGLTRLHVRKPQSQRQEVEKLLAEIDSSFMAGVTIHYHSELVSEMGLGGMHFSYPQIKELKNSGRYTISCSLHQWEELNEVQDKIDYCFMSPVFNSISKAGYPANEALKQVPSFASNVYALGGITETNCEEVLDNGYRGIAVLGYLWASKAAALQRYKDLEQKVKAYDV